MHIGSRISYARREAMEYLYRGSVQDIKERCMIVVLATENTPSYPFQIAKVIRVNKENEEDISIEVHWYAMTHTHLIVCTSERWWWRNKFPKREKENVKM